VPAYEYSNWQYSQHLLPAMDASIGRPLLSTGVKPRVIFQLSMYNGSNTAGSEFAIFVIPATQGDGITTAGEIAIAGDTTFCYGKVDAAITGTQEQIPLIFAPFGTKGTTNGAWACIIPPNCMAVVACVATNMNGTMIANCISAEI